MSQENVEVVRRLWETWDADDLAGMLETLRDDVVTRWHAGLDSTTYRGKEGYLELLTEWNGQFADWSATAEEFIEVGDRVVVRSHQIARGDASGAPVEADYWLVYEVSKGRIVQQDYYPNRSKALEAVGLSE